MMTQDEVLTELRSVIAVNQQFTTWTISTPHIVELVNRAIKQEREACAKIISGKTYAHIPRKNQLWLLLLEISDEIKARGNT